MPKPAPRKSTAVLVNKYGFSTEALKAMQTVTPHLPFAKIVEQWAKYLLASESEFERRWHSQGEDLPLLEELYGEKVVLCKPKAISYQLPGGRYSPDYLYIFESGLRVVVEVKGSSFQKGFKDAKAKMRAAATLHWYDNFLLVMWEKNEWSLEAVKPDPDYVTELQALIDNVDQLNDRENDTDTTA